MLAVALMGFTSILPSENLPVIATQDSILPFLCRHARHLSLRLDATRLARLEAFNRVLAREDWDGTTLAYQLVRVNSAGLVIMCLLSLGVGSLFYIPPFFMSRVLSYLEQDPEREHTEWGWVWVICLCGSNLLMFLVTGKSFAYFSLYASYGRSPPRRCNPESGPSSTPLCSLVRKDIASSSSSSSSDPATASPDTPPPESDAATRQKEKEDKFSSKAQIMTLMTTDVDRVARLTHQLFVLIDAPIELAVGTVFLYNLLGISCFFGLGVAVLCLPLNHYAGKIISSTQDNLMKARDERVALMNEVLGGIRMLKLMAWERSFEARIMKVRAKELKYQRLNYIIEDSGTRNMAPIIVTVVSFYHFAVIRGEALTPSIAFTSSIVSLRRIEKYLHTAEVNPVLPIGKQSQELAFQSCTVTWPQDRSPSSASTSAAPSTASTPRYKFILVDLTLKFPPGELSLICGKLGSGKTLLLLALLGEADVLSGQMMCPRSPADSIASFANSRPTKEDWVIHGICAYVPQAAWLQNASIKENILFNLPYDEERYKLTLEVCALVSDLEILEDGDESEIGERGVQVISLSCVDLPADDIYFPRPAVLLADKSSKFHALCQATGKEEFAMLKKMAGL
ncbi:ABC transporter transmembrane region-domain-containing protein [Mycena leptocephala]|nr:ABC transporter transmembrane region-domain-containing protein [Mycena leptocephala]